MQVHLSHFHASDYIDALRDNDPSEDQSNKDELQGNSKRQKFRERDGSTLDDFGLIDDCALFPGVFDYACRIAGASIQVSTLYPHL